MDDLERQRERRRDRERILNTPNCPRCLHRMQEHQTDAGEEWLCPSCGAVVASG